MSNILVLGGNSFSGNFIASELTSNHTVVSMNRNMNLAAVFKRPVVKPDNFFEYQWNLNDSSNFLETVLKRHSINIVLNFAAQSMVGQSWQHPEDWYQANLVGFSKAIGIVSDHTQLEKFVHFTTPEVYGSTEGWINENFDFSPNSPYAVSRAASDWHLKALHENFDFPVVFTRAANVYGEHQQLYRIVPRTILAALTGGRLPLQGEGNSVRSFIHISDVYSAVERVISNGRLGETYHISTKEIITIRDLVGRICSSLEVDFEKLVEFVADRPGKDFAYKLNSDKIRSELGWTDKVGINEGITLTSAWLSNNLDEIRSMPTEYIHRK
jgi:dTDP-glucose 4,6-dehydratase